MQEELKFIGKVENEVAFVILEGYINMDTSDDLVEQIGNMISKNNCKKFIFDVTKLEYVSSAGIGVFMDLYEKYTNKGGKICFINLKPEIRRVFELVGLMQYFGNSYSMEEAMNFMG